MPILHPSARRLHDFAVRGDDSTAEPSLQEHLAQCAECRAEVVGIRALVSDAGVLRRTAELRHDALDRVHAARASGARVVLPVDGATTVPMRWSERTTTSRAVRVAAAIALIVVPVIGVAQVISYLNRDQTPPSIPVGVTGDHPQSGVTPAVLPRAVSASDSGQQGPATHDLGPVVATSTTTFQGEVNVVALGGGRVAVAEEIGEGTLFVRAFDSTLTRSTVVVDSTFWDRGGTRGYVIPHRGDSAFMLDNLPRPSGLNVISPDGRIDHTLAVPAGVLGNIQNTPRGVTSSSTLGLVYLASQRYPILRDANGQILRDAAPAGQDRWRPSLPPVLLRMSYETRIVDTIARFGPTGEWQVTYAGTANSTGQTLFLFEDQAVATTDGAVAILRARDYRIDWILPDGTVAPPGKPMAYPWTRITEDMRKRLIDSVNAHRQHVYDSTMAKRVADSLAGKLPTRTRVVPVDASTSSSSGTGGGGRGASNGAAPRPTMEIQVPLAAPRPPIIVDERLIPEFFPPTKGYYDQIGSAVLADADNNVWIRPNALRATDGAWVWEIVNRERGLIERVRIPEDRTIAGFGRGGIVYLLARDGGVARIEKVRVRK